MKPFDPTKPCQYRNGEPARILCTDGKSKTIGVSFPVISETINGILQTHQIGGELRVDKKISDYDLVNIPVKRKLPGWVNVYPESKYNGIHETKIVADRHADYERIACLDLSKYNIEFEEGEGL